MEGETPNEPDLNESKLSTERTLPLASAEPTETQNTPEINMARRWLCELRLSLLHTNLGLQQFLFVSLCGDGAEQGRGGGILTGRQAADPALLIKPTCSLTTPAS